MPAPGIETIQISSREQWLAARRQDITASVIAAVAGVDPYRSPASVYAEKLGLIPPPAENELMRRGRWMEAAAVEALRDTYPTWFFERAGVYLRDPKRRLGCTPDLMVLAPDRAGLGLIQIKTVASRVFREQWRGGADGEDAPLSAPLGYQLQTVMEAKLSGVSWAALCAFVVGEFTCSVHLVEIPLDADAEAAWQRMQEAAADFWERVARGLPPPPMPDLDAEVVKAIYRRPKPELEVLDLTGSNLFPALLEERAERKRRIADNIERCEAIDTEIKAAIGFHEAAQFADGWSATWKLRKMPARTIPASESRALIPRRKE